MAKKAVKKEDKTEKPEGLVFVYDFRITKKSITKEDLIEFLRDIAKKWVFQGEKGAENGYEHWQGRLSLKVKKRASTLTNVFLAKFKEGFYIAPTSSENSENDFYVTKEETRIEGPYKNEDKEPNYIQKDYRGNITWKPWQKSIISSLETTPDRRTVNIVLNTSGNVGKSFLVTYLASHEKACLIPPFKEFKEIAEAVIGQTISTGYLIDVPKGLDKNKLKEMYAGIETIKNGYVFDRRYTFKSLFFEPPHIWVFTNSLAGVRDTLSPDRIKIWIVNEENELEECVSDDNPVYKQKQEAEELKENGFKRKAKIPTS
nr:MAG: replication associated protein [Arizlama virus]